MIVWGWRSKKICQNNISIECTHCNAPTMKFLVFQKYFHIFWMPTFPLEKVDYIECQQCKSTYTFNDKEKDDILGDLKTPKWTWIGAVLIACLAAFIAVGAFTSRNRLEELKTNPPASGYFIYKTEDKMFSDTPYILGKITDNDGKEVHITFFLYYSSSPNGLKRKASLLQSSPDDYSDYFDEENMVVPYEDFKDMPIVEFLESK